VALRSGEDPALFPIEHLHLVPEAALVRGVAKGIHQRPDALPIHEGENLPDTGYAEYVQIGRSDVRRTEDRYIVLFDPDKLRGVGPIGRAGALLPRDIAASRTLKQPIYDQAVRLLDRQPPEPRALRRARRVRFADSTGTVGDWGGNRESRAGTRPSPGRGTRIRVPRGCQDWRCRRLGHRP